MTTLQEAPDIADIIAGALQVSRGTAYDLMRSALAQQGEQQPVAVSDAMVEAYLTAQRKTVEEADQFGRPNVGGLHTNTVREACRNGISAALAAAPAPVAQQGEQQPVAWYEYNQDLDAWFLAYGHNPKAKTRPLVFGDTAAPAPQAQQMEPTDDQLVKGVKAMRLFVTKNSVADFKLGYMAALAAAPAPQAQPVDIEALCARIKAADDAAAEGDYMLDSDDCISVIRGTWKAPMLNDKPAPQAQEPIAKLFGTLPVYDTPEPQAQDKSDNYLSGYCTGRTDLLKEQSAQPVAHYDKTEMNAFVQDLYNKKMQEGKHGHYETMFHVVHKAIERADGIREVK